MSINTVDYANQLLAENEQMKLKVNALAAENANMLNAIDQTIGWQQSVDAENTESVRLLVDLKTPATDAAIREIEAQGVGLFAASLNGATELWHPIDAAEEFAARIRAGEVQL